MSLYVLAVDHAGDRRDVEPCLLGDILENHGAQIGLVASLEVIVLVVEYGLHGAAERVLTLFQRLHEPFRGIELLAHESGGLLLGAFGRAFRSQQQVGVFLVHPELGHRDAWHRERKLPVVVLEYEIRYDLLGAVSVGIVGASSRRRIELHDTRHRLLELVLANPHAGDYLLEMFVAEFLEIVADYPSGIHDIPGLPAVPQLEQQTFPEIPRPDTGRLELLDELKHAGDLFRVGLDAGPEGHVVDQRLDVPAKIAVTVERAYDESGDIVLLLREIAAAELIHQALGETRSHRESVVFRSGILPPVVDFQTIGRYVVVILDLVERDLLGLLGLFLGIGGVVKHRIVLQFGTHALLQLLNRQLDELYRLYLKR